MIDNIGRCKISHSLNSFYEGKTISYFVEKPNDNDLLYFGANEELNMITEPKRLLPFVPFSKDSDGGFNSAFYSSNGNEGDIVIDCSYTKFFIEMRENGTPRYIQNIVSWLGASEKHILIVKMEVNLGQSKLIWISIGMIDGMALKKGQNTLLLHKIWKLYLQ